MTSDTALLVQKLVQALTVILHIRMHCTQLLLLHLQHLLQQRDGILYPNDQIQSPISTI